MSNITTYSFHDNAIRTLNSEQNETLFCLADVCKVLTLQNPTLTANQIKEEFGCPMLNIGHVTDSLGREQEATFITEPQLYFVMMRSRAKVAHEFRQWICNEVLPSIRKTGAYKVSKSFKESFGLTDEELAKLVDPKSATYHTAAIANELFGKVDRDTVNRVIHHMVEGKREARESERKIYESKLKDSQPEEGSVVLSKCDADRLRNMLHYMPQALDLLRDAEALLTLLDKSKLLVPAPDLHFALGYEAKCLKKALGE